MLRLQLAAAQQPPLTAAQQQSKPREGSDLWKLLAGLIPGSSISRLPADNAIAAITTGPAWLAVTLAALPRLG